jgi:hypothetical protein
VANVLTAVAALVWHGVRLACLKLFYPFVLPDAAVADWAIDPAVLEATVAPLLRRYDAKPKNHSVHTSSSEASIAASSAQVSLSASASASAPAADVIAPTHSSLSREHVVVIWRQLHAMASDARFRRALAAAHALIGEWSPPPAVLPPSAVASVTNRIGETASAAGAVDAEADDAAQDSTAAVAFAAATDRRLLEFCAGDASSSRLATLVLPFLRSVFDHIGAGFANRPASGSAAEPAAEKDEFDVANL